MPEYEIIKITIVEIKPAVLKALCPCGGGGKSDWIIKPYHAVCSWCGNKLNGDFYAVGRALNGCGGGESDWLIGTDRVVCTWCGETYYTDGKIVGIAKKQLYARVVEVVNLTGLLRKMERGFVHGVEGKGDMNKKATSPNKRVSGFGTMRLRPNFLARTSDTRKTLYDIPHHAENWIYFKSLRG